MKTFLAALALGLSMLWFSSGTALAAAHSHRGASHHSHSANHMQSHHRHHHHHGYRSNGNSGKSGQVHHYRSHRGNTQGYRR